MATLTVSPVQVAQTTHTVHQGDARHLDWIPDESVQLVVTSPPYWTLKEYPANKGQLGAILEYEQFHDELEKVWRHCYRVLAPGGRVCCVVGDVCLARRRNHGRHMPGIGQAADTRLWLDTARRTDSSTEVGGAAGGPQRLRYPCPQAATAAHSTQTTGMARRLMR